VSLAARHLEENGIATIVMGCAKDIVEHCGVPRFLFSDFPLGNAAGRPKDPPSQAFTLEFALRVLESAPAPAPPSSHRCAGARTRHGSSTIRISSAFRRRRSGGNDRNSTGRRKSRRTSATSPEQRGDIVVIPGRGGSPRRINRGLGFAVV
jgi:hypothetical protein